MQPFFIVNPNLSVSDLHDALLEKFTLLQMMHSLLLFGFFNGEKLRVSEGILCDGLWVLGDLLRQVELIQLDLSKRNSY